MLTKEQLEEIKRINEDRARVYKRMKQYTLAFKFKDEARWIEQYIKENY